MQLIVRSSSQESEFWKKPFSPTFEAGNPMVKNSAVFKGNSKMRTLW